MNKKGYDYAALLLLVVIISLVVLFVQIQTKFSETGTTGYDQYNVLKVNNDVKLFERYLKDASGMAMQNVIVDLTKPQSRGNETCPLITETFEQATLEPYLTQQFNKNLNPYLSFYASRTGYKIPYDNFKIGIEQNNFIISAIKPITIPLQKDGKGEATVRPIIILTDYVDKFAEGDEYLEKARNVLRNCDGVQDPFECSKSYLKENAVWERYDYEASGGRIIGMTTKPIEIDMYKVPNTNNHKITFHTLYRTTVCYQVTLNPPAQTNT